MSFSNEDWLIIDTVLTDIANTLRRIKREERKLLLVEEASSPTGWVSSPTGWVSSPTDWAKPEALASLSVGIRSQEPDASAASLQSGISRGRESGVGVRNEEPGRNTEEEHKKQAEPVLATPATTSRESFILEQYIRST